jgi:hypothetical protein
MDLTITKLPCLKFSWSTLIDYCSWLNLAMNPELLDTKCCLSPPCYGKRLDSHPSAKHNATRNATFNDRLLCPTLLKKINIRQYF